MESAELAILERVARNLPVSPLHMRQTEGKWGSIYFAYGTDSTGVPHGIWGYKGVSRNLEFKPEATEYQVQQALVNDAEGVVELMVKKGVFGPINGTLE